MSEPKEWYWSRFADTYDEDLRYIVGASTQQGVISRLSMERDLGEVIELGCGTGYFTKAIAGSATCVLATDLSEEMVEAARTELREFQNITVQTANCEHTGFPSESFDTVVMVNLVHFIGDPIECLQESCRILRRGGLLLVADYTGHGMKWLKMLRMSVRFLWKWGKPPRYAKRQLSPAELSFLVEHSGYRVEEVQLIGDPTHALFLKGRKT